MSTITFKGSPCNTSGNLPAKGANAPDFSVVSASLSELSLKDFSGKTLILNIFPSIDTSVCAMSVRKFNKDAAALKDTVVLCVSMDLPFAQGRFCAAEGIANVQTASDFRHGSIGKNDGVKIADGPLSGLLARAVLVIAPDGLVKYSQLVPEIAQEPDYEAALNAAKS